MRLEVTIDEKSRRQLVEAFRKAPEKTTAGIRKWVNRSATRTVNQGVEESPVITGQLNQSIKASYAKAGLQAEVKPTAKHALYVHEGTGIYGPKKRPITPVRGRVLSWEGTGGRVFARSVKGTKPNKFMDRAYKAIKPTVERDAVATLDQIVRSI